MVIVYTNYAFIKYLKGEIHLFIVVFYVIYLFYFFNYKIVLFMCMSYLLFVHFTNQFYNHSSTFKNNNYSNIIIF